MEFSALGCLKPTLAGKSSNRIPASYGNCAIKIEKKQQQLYIRYY